MFIAPPQPRRRRAAPLYRDSRRRRGLTHRAPKGGDPPAENLGETDTRAGDRGRSGRRLGREPLRLPARLRAAAGRLRSPGGLRRSGRAPGGEKRPPRTTLTIIVVAAVAV